MAEVSQLDLTLTTWRFKTKPICWSSQSVMFSALQKRFCDVVCVKWLFLSFLISFLLQLVSHFSLNAFKALHFSHLGKSGEFDRDGRCMSLQYPAATELSLVIVLMKKQATASEPLHT